MAPIKKILDFLQTDVWRIRAKQLSKPKFLALRQLRIVLLALRGFNEDKCQLRASALTFYSLLSVVPMVAMAFGISKGFGLDTVLQTQLKAKMAAQEEVVNYIINFAQSFLENTKGGVIAGIGIAVLFWTVIKVLGNIEDSFNDIWGIQKARSMGRKFSDYLSMMLICPVLFVMSSSVTVLITSQVKLILDKISILGPIAPLILTLLNILPYMVIWVLFSFTYIFMPNTRVTFKAGMMGGIIAGTVYQVVQWVYITFQIGVAKYGAIYGSFAALPLFLVWLQVSWLVVLFGAEISFAEQNVETYEFEPDCLKASRRFRQLIALRIVQIAVRRFLDGKQAWTAGQIAHQLEAPIRLVNEILFDLTEAGILSEVREEDGKITAFQPAKDTDLFTTKAVLQILDERGIDDIPMAASPETDRIKECIQMMNRDLEKSAGNVALRDI